MLAPMHMICMFSTDFLTKISIQHDLQDYNNYYYEECTSQKFMHLSDIYILTFVNSLRASL